MERALLLLELDSTLWSFNPRERSLMRIYAAAHPVHGVDLRQKTKAFS
jgi:hypothetical protein